MNNAFATTLEEKEPVDTAPWLRQKEQEVLEVIESLSAVVSSKHWKTLEKYIFSGIEQSFRKKLQTEMDEKKIYRLQGNLDIVEKYSDLNKLVDIYKMELKNIRKQLYGNKE